MLVESTHSPIKKEQLHKHLVNVTKCWNDINNASSKYQSDIDQLHLACRKYNCEYVTFNIYLTRAEALKNGFQPVTANKVLLLKQLAEAEVDLN